MTKPAHETFITIEETLADAVRAIVEAKTQTIADDARAAWDAGKPEQARHIIDSFTLHGAFDALRPRLVEIALNAVLFGGSRHKPVHETVWLQDPTVPHDAEKGADLFITILERDGAEIVRKRLHRFIDEATGRTDDQYELFRKAEMTIDEFAQRINEVANGTATAIVDIAANVSTSRLASYGFLAQAQEDGLTRYQISAVLDERTCPVCAYMHGKVMDVSAAFDQTQEALSTSDPEELRRIAPWPKQDAASLRDLYDMTADELQDEGYGTPPFHPRCRCILVPVGEVKDPMSDATAQRQRDLFGALVEDKPVSSEYDRLAELIAGVADDATRDVLFTALDAEEFDLIEQYFNTGRLPAALKKPA